MATLYYGNGNCSVQGENIVGVQINYRGAVQITDKTDDNYIITANNRMILIVPVGQTSPLGELFEYKGEMKVSSVVLSDNNANRVLCSITKNMDFPELMHSSPEDITIPVNKMNAGYRVKNKIKNTKVDKNILKNQNTSKGGKLYMEDGTLYNGAYHIHLESNKIMTGADHSDTSEVLKQKIVKRKIKTIKTTPRKTTSKPYRSSGGSGGSGGGGY